MKTVFFRPQSEWMRDIAIALFAILDGFVFTVFILPNGFAPSGINGLATMVQHLFGLKVAYLSLAVNLPLLWAAFRLLNRRYAFRTLLFVSCYSVSLLILGRFDLSDILFRTGGTGDAILPAIAGGFFGGLFYSLSVRVGGSTGGTDIIAGLFHRRHPETDTVWIIFSINAAIAVLSFFVYGRQYTPVILCIVYCFVSSKVSDTIFKGIASAARFDVITDAPMELANELMQKLGHGCTVIPAKGMFTGSERSLLICVVNRRQVVDFEQVLNHYPTSFACISTVNRTFGNFKRKKGFLDSDHL